MLFDAGEDCSRGSYLAILEFVVLAVVGPSAGRIGPMQETFPLSPDTQRTRLVRGLRVANRLHGVLTTSRNLSFPYVLMVCLVNLSLVPMNFLLRKMGVNWGWAPALLFNRNCSVVLMTNVMSLRALLLDPLLRVVQADWLIPATGLQVMVATLTRWPMLRKQLWL